MGRKELPFFFPKLLFYSLLHLYCIHGSHWMALGTVTSFGIHSNQIRITSLEGKNNTLLSFISPNQAPQPFTPFGAPPPLAPLSNDSVPKLSGRFVFNLSSLDTMINTTAIDCSAFFAPLLANVVCYPQLHATLTILAGQSSKDTGKLALDMANVNHCLTDVQAILASKLRRICYVGPLNLTEASCPISSVNEFESLIDTTRLLTACKKVDAVNECCSQICHNEILDAATKIAFKVDYVSKHRSGVSVEHSPVIDDCKFIVLRWLASKLDPLSANQVLRRISNCNLNQVPLSPVIDDCKFIVLRWLASKLDPLSANQVLRRISNCNLNKVCPLTFPE